MRRVGKAMVFEFCLVGFRMVLEGEVVSRWKLSVYLLFDVVD